MKEQEHFVIFDFSGNLHLVRYWSDDDIELAIKDNTADIIANPPIEDMDYMEIIEDVMMSFDIDYEIIEPTVVRDDEYN